MAARSQFNSKSPTIKRILREAAELSSTPSPDYTATPQDDNLFEWHFTLRGPPGIDTPTAPSEPTSSRISGPYAEGIYHGRIVLPPTYPLRPPSFRFLTPSGRFETNREICLSISGHHEETWQPAWGLRTALVALRTFMETDAKGQIGGLECTDSQRRRLAKESRGFKCSMCGKSNEEILKECEEASKLSEQRKEIEIPKELKMGYKDEMGQIKENTDGDADPESTELAEGFVQTAPIVDATNPSSTGVQTLQTHSEGYTTARPAQSIPRPTATIPLPQHEVPMAVRIRNNSEGVPAWVDKAIMGIIVCLVVIMVRILGRM